jgi:ketosteroid isomerase-like protein
LLAAGPEDAVVAAEKQWAKAVTSNDYAALEQILSPELIYAHSTGVIETKSDYLGKLKSGTQKYDVIDHQKTTVKLHGTAAAAHSIVIMQGVSPTGPFDNRLMMMHLWVKSGGKWQLAAHQTTKLER